MHVFTLQENVTFHDGTPLTADSIVENTKRWALLAQNTESDASYPYRVFFSPLKDGKNSLPLIKSVTAQGNTVTITLNRPSTSFLAALTQPAFGIVKPGTWDAATGFISEKIVGTGAFYLDSWEDQRAVLHKNENYWGEPARIDTLEFTAISSSTKRYYALLEGDIDAYDQVDNNDFVPLAKAGFITHLRDPFAGILLDLNLDHPVLGNLYVRRAIAHAVNRWAVNPLLPQGSYDTRSYIPRSLQLPEKEFDDYFSHREDLAQAILQRSGYQGEEITFYYPTGVNLPALPQPEAIYAHLAESLSKIGLNIKPVPIAYQENYHQKVSQKDSARGISLIEHFGSYRTPMAFVDQLLGRLPDQFFSSPLASTKLFNAPLGAASSSEKQDVEISVSETTPLPENFTEQLARALTAAENPDDLEAHKEQNLRVLHLLSQLVPAVPVAFTVSAVAQNLDVTHLSVNATGLTRLTQVDITP